MALPSERAQTIAFKAARRVLPLILALPLSQGKSAASAVLVVLLNRVMLDDLAGLRLPPGNAGGPEASPALPPIVPER
jgi:hypothetical protein